jgi:hypothetical protein
MRISMNTALSGNGWVDDIQSHPKDEIRGQTKLVKITGDVRKYAAEHGLTDAEAIESGVEEKRKEFVEQGAEVYAKDVMTGEHRPLACWFRRLAETKF